MRTDATIRLDCFYHEAFVGDRLLEEIREAKVAEVIKSMGDKYLLAVPVQKLTKGEIK